MRRHIDTNRRIGDSKTDLRIDAKMQCLRYVSYCIGSLQFCFGKPITSNQCKLTGLFDRI